jgi:hypothetical protein
MRCSSLVLFLATLAGVASAGDPAAPAPVDLVVMRTPHFLRPADGAPAIANPVVSFYAKRGETREALMLYHAQPGEADSTVFVRFKVGAKSLSALPDGSPIAQGDSVLITLTLTDPQKLIVDFQPAGLRFNVREPAELRMSYAEADPDLNDDGVVNKQDSSLTRKLRIWRAEAESDPFAPLASTVVQEAHEVEAQIGGFTRYAVAY